MKPTIEELKAKIADKGYSLLVTENSVIVEGKGQRITAWARAGWGRKPLSDEQFRRLLHRVVNELGWRMRG